MAGETETIEVAPGVELEITNFTPEENKIFDAEFSKLVTLYTKLSTTPSGKHAIYDLFLGTKEAFRVIAQAAKREIQPAAGVFNGMRALTGFGWRLIRPDDILPAAQGRTWDKSVSGLTPNDWYGLYHNGAIGDAYNVNPLYLRKEIAIGIVGFMDLNNNAIITQIKWEIDSKELPVYNMEFQMRGTDLPIFRMPKVEYLRPAKQYRCQAKFTKASGDVALVPLGITFVKSDWLRLIEPTQPSTTAP